MSSIQLMKNFLDEDLLNEVTNFCANMAEFKFTGSTSDIVSMDRYYERIFWISHQNNNELFVERIFNEILKKTGKKYEIDQVYINGQTIGQEGSFHTDWSEPTKDNCTFLLYINPEIREENADVNGGYTSFKYNDEIISIPPIYNRAVLFDGDIIHKASAPLDHNLLRKTIAFKLKKIE